MEPAVGAVWILSMGNRGKAEAVVRILRRDNSLGVRGGGGLTHIVFIQKFSCLFTFY